MDINKMMKQAQQMQAKVVQAQKELEEKAYEYEVNQMIKIEAKGSKEITKIDVSADLLEADNKEILEDMLVVALNGIFEKIDEETEAVMSKATGNMKLPGM